MTEAWKACAECSAYEVSNLGRVRRVGATRALVPGLVSGYPSVSFWKDNRQVGTFYVHRLVMSAFAGSCPEGMQVAHRDGDRINAEYANLEYVTQSANEGHKIQHGRDNRGSRHINSKLSEDVVRQMRARFSAGETVTSLAAEFEVSLSVASRAINKVTWRHVL